MERFEPKREDNMTGGQPIPEDMQKANKPPHHPAGDPSAARDGFDNTGTQGYDSLSDEGYSGSSDNAGKEGPDSHTGSSSEDFKGEKRADGLSAEDENNLLNGSIG